MADADATSRRSQRSRARLTDEHLRRLAALAEEDHAFFRMAEDYGFTAAETARI